MVVVTVRDLAVYFHRVERSNLEKVLLWVHDYKQERQIYAEVSATPVICGKEYGKPENERIAMYTVNIKCLADVPSADVFEELRRDLTAEGLITGE